MSIRLLFIFLLAGSAISATGQDTVRVNLWLKMADHDFLKPGRAKSDLDSSLYYSQSAEVLSQQLGYKKGTANSYEQISKILHVNGKVEEARSLALNAIDIFRANKLFNELGEAYFDLAGYYSLEGGQLAQRMKIVEKSLDAFQQAQNPEKIAVLLEELGDLSQLQGNYPAALAKLKQALAIFESIHYPTMQGIYDLMGNICAETGDFEEAIKYGLLAIKTAEAVKDTSLQVATIYNRLAISYEMFKKYEEANDWYQRSLRIAEKYKDEGTIIILRANLAKNLLNLQRPHEALTVLEPLRTKQPGPVYYNILIASRFLYVYNTLKQYGKARIWSNRLLKLSASIDAFDEDQTTVYITLVLFYISTKQYANAYKYLVINDKYSRKLTKPMLRTSNEKAWFQLDSAQGHYLAAIEHYQRYKLLQDSTSDESTHRRVEQLQIQYETAKKDQNIAVLTGEAQLQKASLRQAEITRNWILSSLVLLILLLALGYNRYRLKQKSTRKLEAQQLEIIDKNVSLQHLADERAWLVKEIHHRVKNNFHMVNGLLGTQLRYLKNEQAIEAIGQSRRRVEAMALIHQRLYRSENITAIDMDNYIHELVDYLRDSFNISRIVQFKYRIDRVELDLMHSIPIGLILNEAITNAMKYAFDRDQSGVISISLIFEGPGRLLLTVSDNGVGIPPTFDLHARNSMGMHLMRGLSEEIEGKFQIVTHPGTEIRVTFPYPDSTTEVGSLKQETSTI